jgi:hypothetical protein
MNRDQLTHLAAILLPIALAGVKLWKPELIPAALTFVLGVVAVANVFKVPLRAKAAIAQLEAALEAASKKDGAT